MAEETKEVIHFNRGTVWGRLDGVPTSKLSNEGKGRKKDSKDKSSKKGNPFYRLKVVCPSSRGNAFAFGNIWNVEKANKLIDYLKKNPGAGVKLVGWFNQYDHFEEETKTTKRRSSYTWHDWYADKCEDPRASFSLVGVVSAIEEDILSLHLERKGSQAEDFKIYALEPASMERLTTGDIVQVKGYLRSKYGEDEFGDTDNSPILPYFSNEHLVIRERAPF